MGGVRCEVPEDPPLRGQHRGEDRGLPGCGAARRQALEVRARGLRRAGGGGGGVFTHHPPRRPSPVRPGQRGWVVGGL